MLWLHSSHESIQNLQVFDKVSSGYHYGVIGCMSKRISYPRNEFCRSCLDEEMSSIPHLRQAQFSRFGMFEGHPTDKSSEYDGLFKLICIL